tara:strand:- start:29 stop:325 length:297 start_codon:yes stop_codon:yes gene_type:complete
VVFGLSRRVDLHAIDAALSTAPHAQSSAALWLLWTSQSRPHFESAAAVKTSQARSLRPKNTAATTVRIAPEPARRTISEERLQAFSPLYTATQPRTAH